MINYSRSSKAFFFFVIFPFSTKMPPLTFNANTAFKVFSSDAGQNAKKNKTPLAKLNLINTFMNSCTMNSM